MLTQESPDHSLSGRIDVHHHILPARYVSEMGSTAIGGQGSSGKVPYWSVSDAITSMDKAGISTSICSVSAPGFHNLTAAKATVLVRHCNEVSAMMCSEYPTRFGMFAALPLPDVDASLREIEHAFDQMKADGVCMLSNYGGSYLGETQFKSIYEELNRRSAVVFIHPTTPIHPVAFGLSMSTLEFPFDTTRTIASLILNGITAAFPRIRFIASHAGGAMPYLVERIEQLSQNNPSIGERVPHGFGYELRKFFFDTALSANHVTFGSLLPAVDHKKILFGTDYPFGPKNQTLRAAEALASLCSEQVTRLKDIERENALTLFPRFDFANKQRALLP
ncbi:MAG: amidohydrolase family protein [Burkholderiaceae bacterium]|nr:amidohydrolase family protein [Burkholderiaceae bacterium]